MSSVGAVVSVWLTVQLLGASVLPLTLTVFRNIPGRGYFFSKTFGILAITYLTWLAGSLNLWPFGIASIVISIAIWGGVSLYFGIRDWWELKNFVISNIGHILTVELIFISSFAISTIIKSYNSDIVPLTERFMDFALLKSVLRGDGFPLSDPWYAGEPVNYYYFGHITAAVLNVLSGLPSEVFFNIAVALIFSLLTVGSFSLGYSLTRRASYGLLTSMLVVLVGNMDGFLQAVRSKVLHPFDWFRSSRIIPGTINEFPFFSFIWGDLHAYVLAFPLIPMVLAMGYNLLISGGYGLKIFGDRRPDRVLHLAVLGLSMGSLFLINSWDYPTYTLIIVSAILIQQLSTTHENASTRLARGLFLVGLVIAVSIVPYMPYLSSFQQSREVKVIADKTTLNEFLTIFGLFVFFLASLLAYLIGRIDGNGVRPPLILLAASSALIISRRYAFILLGVILFVTGYLFLRNLKDKPTAYSLLLFGVGAGLGLGGEFFYLNDHFGSPFERMNTIFKIYLQVWVCWAVASAFSLYLIGNALTQPGRGRLRWVWKGLLVVLVGASLIYPVAATYSRTNKFKNKSSLSGLEALRAFSPADHQAIVWINSHIRGKPVILEATGDAYTWNARVSSFTGLPTVLGWGTHEAGWRNSWGEVLQRMADVRTIYSTADIEAARNLMAKYRVEYVYIGPLERSTYPKEGLDKFSRFMDTVYDSNNVQIYQKLS
jgi:YYY domain-containing protein